MALYQSPSLRMKNNKCTLFFSTFIVGENKVHSVFSFSNFLTEICPFCGFWRRGAFNNKNTPKVGKYVELGTMLSKMTSLAKIGKYKVF